MGSKHDRLACRWGQGRERARLTCVDPVGNFFSPVRVISFINYDGFIIYYCSTATEGSVLASRRQLS